MTNEELSLKQLYADLLKSYIAMESVCFEMNSAKEYILDLIKRVAVLLSSLYLNYGKDVFSFAKVSKQLICFGQFTKNKEGICL